ncbi:MAG: hypothetical protein HS111_20585 [Kofleriaceae bacterium]|nr:hypothetical protein [Kofleriaceae bacterium]
MADGRDIPAEHVGAVLEGIDAALSEAEAAGDDRALANLLAAGAHAALRKGDARTARTFGERAARARFQHHTAQYDAIRAQGFAATAAGDLETALHQTIKARVLARDRGRHRDLAEQSCTLAALYLALGAPAEARSCADAALGAARHEDARDVAASASAWRACADGETGLLDHAVDALAAIDMADLSVATQVDVAACARDLLAARARRPTATPAPPRTRRRRRSPPPAAPASITAAPRSAHLARAAARRGGDARARGSSSAPVARRTRPSPPRCPCRRCLAAGEPSSRTSTDTQRQVMLGAAARRVLRTASAP